MGFIRILQRRLQSAPEEIELQLDFLRRVIMMALLSAALAAAAPAVQPTPAADLHAQHMGQAGKHEQTERCACCKDMAKKNEGHAGHDAG